MTCEDALQNLFQNISETSAKALDSFGKVPPGVLTGNTAWWGDYDECSALDSLKYCLLTLNANSSTADIQTTLLKYEYGVCVPSVCSSDDINKYAQQLLFLTPLKINTVSGIQCQEATSYDAGFICFTIFCSILLLLMLFGAALDVFKRHKKKPNSYDDEDVNLSSYKRYDSIGQNGDATKPDYAWSNERKPLLGNEVTKKMSEGDNVVGRTSKDLYSTKEDTGVFQEILLSFAFNRNLRKLLNSNQSEKTISCLNGIRVISITWVALGHCYLFSMSVGPENTMAVIDQTKNFTFQAVGNAFLSVDTFFFMSGLLVAHLSLQRMKESNGKLPFLLFYFHRFIRLTPLYAFVILFGIYLFPYLGNGPVWYKVNQISDVCSKYWWQNLLYINNFFPAKERCLQWSWYLSNDMQFYIITPLLLIPIFSFPGIGLAILAALMLISFTVTGALIGYYDLTINVFGMLPMSMDGGKSFFEVVYVKPYCRMVPYLVGFSVGYAFFKQVTENRRIRLTPSIVALGWTLASLVGIMVVYGTYSSFQGPNGPLEDDWTTAQNVAYGMFSRFAWAVTVTWVVTACHFGYGGWVNDFLSWSFWIPLSRLTYSAYLIHGFVINYYYFALTSPLHASSVFFAYFFCGTVMISYGAAVLFSLTIEYPFANLEKLLLQRIRGSDQTRQPNSSMSTRSDIREETQVLEHSSNP